MPRSDQDNGSIFDGLNENAVTIVFGNLLEQYISVRQALQRTLSEDVQEEVNLSYINSVETHRSGGSGEGIPDLIIRGHGFVLVIEIKVKKERGLQPAQQKAYIPFIREAIQDPQTPMGIVVFLIPDDYLHLDQLKQCLENARGLCRADNSNIQVLKPIKWRQFLEAFDLQNMSFLNELIREFYNYLIPKPVIFSTEEVRLMHSNEVASGIRKLIKIVDKVNLQLRLRNPHQDSSGYGYNFSDRKRKKFVWFGIWWEYWAKKGFPLCIAVSEDWHSQSILNEFKKQPEIQFEDFEDDCNQKWLVVGVLLKPDTDCSALIGKIVTDIETLLREDGSEESSEDAETS